jgi:hypothetical protein
MWTDAFKKSFVNLLETNCVEVTFTKVNGEDRVIKATLMPSAFKDYQFVNSNKPKHNDVCAVWDMECQEWRSFRFDSIKKFSLIIE